MSARWSDAQVEEASMAGVAVSEMYPEPDSEDSSALEEDDGNLLGPSYDPNDNVHVDKD